MVEGLERFRDHFRDHVHQYALIGGAACDLAMDEVGLAFRATKDLDIVLIVEEIDANFGRTFWDFIRAGRFLVRESSAGRPQYYRFSEPQEGGYPSMLEIFAARPQHVLLAEGSHLTPIPVGAPVSSMSAILLQDDYYAFLRTGIRSVQGIPVVGADRLIPLKARAWLDLRERKIAGQVVNSRDMRKHRNDVFRLYVILDPAPLADIPSAVQADLRGFLDVVRTETIDLKALGVARDSLDAVLRQLGRIYGVG